MKTARGHKVGFFDSGVGGLSVLRAFQALCPEVETEYLADADHAPYGNRPAEEIACLSEANAEELIARGCDVVVVACNTATAAAIDLLRRKHPDIPFVGVEPAVKPAALGTRSGVIGIIGPRRMDYAGVMAKLEFLSKQMGALHGFKPALPLIETGNEEHE